MKKRCHRRPIIPKPPRGLRRPLDRATLNTVGMYHVQNLDAIASGQAAPAILWDVVGGVLIWWHVAQALQAGVAEMEQQLALAQRLVERFARTGRVLFDGPDLQLARVGVDVMDQLAAITDDITATEAAIYSTAELARIIARIPVPTTAAAEASAATTGSIRA